MIVVADTSPIQYLIQIEEIPLLGKMYGLVVVPAAVREELLHPSAPEAVRRWAGKPPSWIEFRTPTTSQDLSLAMLDAGERAAILLAEELRADQLLIDDREGRQEAIKRGLAVLGTLGVLREASALGLLDLRAALGRLQTTKLYCAGDTRAHVVGTIGLSSSRRACIPVVRTTGCLAIYF